MSSQTHSRRGFLSLSGLSALSLALAACGGGSSAPPAEAAIESPEEALLRLLEGNARFVADKNLPIDEGKDRRAKLVKRQRPFATVFSCVDSRVPPELVFDRGLGDLFVIRTAGEVIDQAVLGSIEYGVAELEIPLLVVLGHSGCGAVKATVTSMTTGEAPDADIAYLVTKLTPAVEAAKAKLKPAAKKTTKKPAAATTTTTAAEATKETTKEGTATTVPAAEADPNAELITTSIEMNVEMVVEALKAAPILAEKVKKDRLLVVGGIYDLETGKVEITVNLPEEVKKALEAATTKDGKSTETTAAGGETTTTAKG
jgi:carbonic anhydrase